jgi:hypothetical protein
MTAEQKTKLITSFSQKVNEFDKTLDKFKEEAGVKGHINETYAAFINFPAEPLNGFFLNFSSDKVPDEIAELYKTAFEAAKYEAGL